MSDPWCFVTGFGPFPGVTENPTQALSERLDETLIGEIPVRARTPSRGSERA